MGRYRKHERNQAMLTDFIESRKAGAPMSYMVIAKKYGIDVSYTYQIIQREAKEQGISIVDKSN